MELAIAHNPYSEEPEELIEALKMEAGDSYLEQLEPDIKGLQDLQSLISPNMQK